MVAESCTEATFALERECIQKLKRELKKLFMVAADPATRLERAQEKITEARSYLSTLEEQYKPENCPKGVPQDFNQLFAELEASCENAEKAMQRFEGIYLRRISNS